MNKSKPRNKRGQHLTGAADPRDVADSSVPRLLRGDLQLDLNAQPADRLIAATIHELLHTGLRRLRTQQIAQVANTTESTLYRHFGSLDGLLFAACEQAWRLVNRAVSESMFLRPPLGDDPVNVLLDDMAAIWGMREQQDTFEAATVAFLFLRRRAELLGPDAEDDPEQERFQHRIDKVTTAIAERYGDEDEDRGAQASLLTNMVINYGATVWLTWFCMPAGSDDVTEQQHDLTPDECQMGVLTLVEQVLSVSLDELRIERPEATHGD